MARDDDTVPAAAPRAPAGTPACPHCGTALVPLEGQRGVTAPLLCPGCSRNWWRQQLTPHARRLWDRALQGYPPGESVPLLQVEMMVERDEAVKAERGRRGDDQQRA